jgi:prophage regulatory protein
MFNTSEGRSNMAHTILRLPAVRARTGLSRSGVYDRVVKGTFPAPVSLGARAVGWIEAEIDHWIEQRIQDSRKTIVMPAEHVEQFRASITSARTAARRGVSKEA